MRPFTRDGAAAPESTGPAEDSTPIASTVDGGGRRRSPRSRRRRSSPRTPRGFPMDEVGARGPVGLYTCDPRGVLPIEGFRVPRSVRRALRARRYAIRVDGAFTEVAAACAGPRAGGTWLTPRLVAAYVRLHRTGVGAQHRGLGRRPPGGRALRRRARRPLHLRDDVPPGPGRGERRPGGRGRLLGEAGFTLWDIQMTSPHTLRFGALALTPEEYRGRLADALDARPRPSSRPRAAAAPRRRPPRRGWPRSGRAARA